MRSKRATTVVAIFAALAALLPSSATATEGAVSPCSAWGASTGSRMTGIVAAHAVQPGAAAFRLGCGIVQNGRLVAYVRATSVGVAAAGASTFSIPIAPYSVCADLYVLNIDGSSYEANNCPP